jgi:hypothetical protein
MMELVDFNELYIKETSGAAKKAKTTRRGRAKKVEAAAPSGETKTAATPKARKSKSKKDDAEGEASE